MARIRKGFMEYIRTISIVEGILFSNFGVNICLKLKNVLKESQDFKRFVLRVQTDCDSVDVPNTLIIKGLLAGAESFRREYAALEFLSSIEELRGIFPRLYGFDRDAEILVIEDISPDDTLQLRSILFGTNAEKAEKALMEFQRTVGKMHATTTDHKEEYIRLLSQYDVKDAKEIEDYRGVFKSLQVFGRNPEWIGIRAAPGLEQEISSAMETLRNPQPFLGFDKSAG